jgi:hypothetical protein
MVESTIAILASIGIPIALLIGVMMLQKWLRKRNDKRSPLTDKLFHQPGEQLRKHISHLDDGIDERVTRLIVIGPVMLLAILLPRVNWPAMKFGVSEGLVGVFAIFFVAWNIRSVSKLWNARIAAQSGLSGELATAQELNRLQAKGCIVFHDLPGNRGNIDHIVIGQSSVLAIETKWRSKHGKGNSSAEVTYVGKVLRFSGGSTTSEPLDQAQACARELSKFLFGKTGEHVHVVPVVALPGWFVKVLPGAESADVKVLNPKRMWSLLDNSGPAIPGPQRIRIADRIAERYPEQSD